MSLKITKMEHKDYQKINTIYKRDFETNRLILGDWSLPEFEYLKGCKFRAEEKIDGTNIQIRFNGVRVEFGGRTDKANIPPHLLIKLEELFTVDKMRKVFPPENEDDFDGTNQTYALMQTAFDFSEYIPKNDYIQATQFAFSPMYIYGWNTQGPSGHVNTGILSLLTNWQLPANFSITLNAYAFREWYDGNMLITDGTQSYSNANYYMFLAWLNYSNTLYQFNDNTSLSFNFVGGLDPYISSNKKAAWDPFIAGNQMSEWLSPTIMDGNYKSTYTLFALPQLSLNYQYNKALNLSAFVQAKYSNQVWGSTEKDWELQPQGGVGIRYAF